MQAENTTQAIQPTSTEPLHILRRRQVEEKTGFSRSTLYHYIKIGHFPKPTPLGPRVVGWLESEVNSWICERIGARRDNSSR